MEGSRRLRGALRPLLCAAALGSWLNAGAAYALDVPHDAVLQEDAELLPVTLNPPGTSLVFGSDEHCSSPVPSAPGDAVANVQMDAAGLENGTQMEPEDGVLAATAKQPACIPQAAAFAAAGEPFFAAHAAGSSFAFSATLGQLAMFAGVPAVIAKIAQAIASRNGGGRSMLPANGPGNGPGPGPVGGGAGPGGGTGGNPPTPTPEPVSTVLLIAGAALVGRAVHRHAGR